MSPVAALERIRPARAAELEVLCGLWLEIARHHQGLGAAFRLRQGSQGEVRELLRSLLRDPAAAAFVFESEHDVVGLVCVRIDRAPSMLEETARAEITELGVRRGMRRRGVGRALVEAALGWVRERNVERVEVRVAAANAEGQAFWRRLGFGDHVHVLHRAPGGPTATPRRS